MQDAFKASHARWTAGVLCIILVSVIWTFATVLKQIVFTDLSYNEPLVFTWVCNACYMVHLPLYALLSRLKRSRSNDEWSPPGESTEDRQLESNTHCDSSHLTRGSSAGRQAILAATLIAPLWFAAQWTYSEGVARTSVTSSTLISATSVVWTLIGGVAFKVERLSWMKAIGVASCLLGNVATEFGDLSRGDTDQALGDFLCLISALCYAAYTTALKRLVHEEVSVLLLFGTLGSVIFVGGLPIVLIFGLSGLQRLSPMLLGLLLFNGLFDNVLSQFAWLKAVQWTSPTAATVGQSLTVPLSILADVLRHRAPRPIVIFAGALVTVGFVLVTLATRPPDVEPLRTSESREEESSSDRTRASCSSPHAVPLGQNRE